MNNSVVAFGAGRRQLRGILFAGALLASFAAAPGASPGVDMATPAVATPQPTSTQADPSAHGSIVSGYGKLPLSFEPNDGQASASVNVARGIGYGVSLTERGAILRLRKGLAGKPAKHYLGVEAPRAPAEQALLRFSLVHSRPHAVMHAEQLQDSVSNYFIGNDRSKWRSEVANYGAVRYEQVYPGVDWLVYGNPQQLEYDLVVTPKADPQQIKLRIEGADSLALDDNGDLLVKVHGRTLRQLKPVIYQGTANGSRQKVEGRYVLDPRRRQIAFEIGAFDHSRSLVIDPALAYSTYLGGSGTDSAFAIAVDTTGNAYVAGQTTSTDFPTASPYQAATAGASKAFVTKFNNAGALVYSTYLGGSRGDAASSIAVDGAGNVYVAGATLSTDFPTTNPLQSTNADSANGVAFVTKFNAAGSALIYSTYLGGSGDGNFGGDQANAVALDNAGSLYVTGSTTSANFPTTNPLQSVYAGNSDVFVSKLNPAGSALLYSTYLGGSNRDYGKAIAVDNAGNAYVSGQTFSTNFPTASPLQSVNGGGNSTGNGFVAKLSTSGSALVYSTYLGGSNGDTANAIAVDSAGSAYVAGQTNSTDFPTVNPLQSTFGSDGDAFASKFNTAGSALVYSTYLGSGSVASSIAVDSAGNAYVAGGVGGSIPVVDPVQSTNAGSQNAFVSKFNASGSALLYSTYLGGSGADAALAIAVDSAGNAYVAGITQSTNFPTASPMQSANAGGQDGFVTKILNTVPGAPTGLTATPGNTQAGLSWNAVSSATSYRVYQGTIAGGEAATPAQSGITSTSATITGLNNGNSYFFTVTAVNASGAESAHSAEVSVTPFAPLTATPTFNPPAGTYIALDAVAISDATTGATIYYTTDGSTPTTASNQYLLPIILLLNTTTIKAIATAPSLAPSSVASATYVDSLFGSSSSSSGSSSSGASSSSGSSSGGSSTGSGSSSSGGSGGGGGAAGWEMIGGLALALAARRRRHNLKRTIAPVEEAQAGRPG